MLPMRLISPTLIGGEICGEHSTKGRGGSRNLFWGGSNQGPQSKARIEGAKRPSTRAKPESRARSARELRAKPEPRAKLEKNRGGFGEGAR